MKNALIIVLFTLSASLSATTYYIDPSGNNANNGSSSSPWETLAYACSKVTTPGDIIHVNAGTFTETSQCILALGVSIVGAGNTSIIHSHNSSANLIELYSSSTANGNQSISYIQMEGGSSVSDLVGNTAIKVWGRSNVNIHHCTFQNFSTMGVIFYGGATVPTTFPTGCQFHDNIVTNCSKMLPGQGDTGEGSLCIGGTQGMLVFNNTITCNLRVSGNNGYPIKFAGEGVNKGLKIYNNTLTADHVPDGGGFNFAIELWSSAGGIEIYNNRIKGTIDCVNTYKTLASDGVPYPEGAYSKGIEIHDNIIGWDALMPLVGDGEVGIRIEMNAEDVYIYNNNLKNLGAGIILNTVTEDPLQHQNNIYIYYNIFENIGADTETNSKGWGIYTQIDCKNSEYNNWNILNNVISAKTNGGTTMWGINLPWSTTTIKNITIRNNIIQNFSYTPIIGDESPSPKDYFSIENNIFYNNGNNNNFRGDISLITHYTNQNNFKNNPLFISSNDFHLQSGSPAIGKGLAITGITTDYAGNAVQKPPEIGAYEYASNPPSPVIPVIPVYQNSVVENATPSLLEMTYDLNLNNLVVPSTSSFKVLVNSVARTVSSVAISGNKVQLTLASAIKSGDIVTVSYTKPASNPLQTSTGGLAVSISTKPVTNNCIVANKANDPPVVVINYPITAYAGFISEIDATSTYDPNNDPLVVEWTVPTDVPVSTVKSLKTQVLAPVVDNSKVVAFQLKVSDGITLISNDIQIIVLPYKPELAAAKITNIKASDFQPPDYPNNIVDGNTETKWSSNGDNQWLLLTLAGPFKISHLVLAFLQGQQYESYFDIYASKDNLIWEHILTAVASCNFSGARQVFDFPALYTNTEYSYLKYVGHGNSLNNLNIISEIKIFGSPRQNSNSDNSKEKNVIIYPNPARDFLNISIKEPTMEPDKVRIIDLSGKIVFEKVLNPVIKNVQIPISLKSGIYMVDLCVGNLILFAQKLIVRN